MKVDNHFISELEALKDESPEKALSLATDYFAEAPTNYKARLLGIAGSSLRRLLRNDEAKASFGEGLRWAALTEDTYAEADLMNRAAYLFQDEADLDAALACTSCACELYLLNGRPDLAGRSIMIKGFTYHHLGKTAYAVNAWEGALKILADDDAKYRFSTLHALATAANASGDTRKAIHFAMKSGELASSLPPFLRAVQHWLMGRLSIKLGADKDAEDHLSSALDIYVQAVQPNAILVGTELVDLLVGNGMPHRAYEVARELLKLVEPMRHNKVIGGAITDLLRGGQQALTRTLTDRVWREVRVGLKNNPTQTEG
jgi:tetratricopeptide (TPR) repeat protein